MRQRFAEAIGADGCYFLCLVHIAEGIVGHRIDAIAEYERFTAMGCMTPDCYLVHPDRILSSLTGRPWSVSKDAPGYKPKPGEYVVQRWERSAGSMSVGHFVLPDWDPYWESKTVKEGKLVSLRVFKPL